MLAFPFGFSNDLGTFFSLFSQWNADLSYGVGCGEGPYNESTPSFTTVRSN